MRLSHAEAEAIAKAVQQMRKAHGTQVQIAPRPPASWPLFSRLAMTATLAGGSTAYLQARRDGMPLPEAGNEAVKGMLPGIAMTAISPMLKAYAPAVAKVAARGNLALLAGMTAWNAGHGAVAGYKAGGIKAAAKGAGWGALDTVTFGGATAIGGYLDTRAKQRAGEMSAATRSRTQPAVATARSDGTTEGYTAQRRTRSGGVSTVRVGSYQTPKRFA